MNTATKTIEQLKLELQQAREREQREKQAAEKAKRDAEEEELNKKMRALLQPIYTALQSAKITCTLQGNTIATGNYNTNVHIEREERRSGSGFYARSSYTGRFVVSVGTAYRNFPRVRYPQKKDSTFNVDKIVQTIRRRIAFEANAKAEREKTLRQKEQAVKLAERLQKELGTDCIVGVCETHRYDRSGRPEFHSYPAPADHVYVKVGTPLLNEAQARVLIKALAEVAKLATKKDAS